MDQFALSDKEELKMLRDKLNRLELCHEMDNQVIDVLRAHLREVREMLMRALPK